MSACTVIFDRCFRTVWLFTIGIIKPHASQRMVKIELISR